MTRAVALVVLAVALAGWVALRPGVALGHATLVRAEPPENAFLQRAPLNVSLTFSEPVDARGSYVRVLDAAGKRIDGSVALQGSPNGLSLTLPLAELKPGIYNVLWANVSAVDGHGARGSYPFTVLKADGSLPDEVNQVSGLGSDADPAPLPEGVAVRALSLMGLVLATAGAILLLLLPRPSAARRGLGGAIFAGGVVLAVATVLNLALIRDIYADRSLGAVVFETNAGHYWLVRAVATAAVLAAVGIAIRWPRLSAVAALSGVAAYLWAYSATSHGAAGSGSAWGTGIDFVHTTAAIGWIGGVVGVATSVRLMGRSDAYGRLMPRFAALASSMVFLLLATGFLNTLIEFNEFKRLWTTGYGITLLVKLGLLAPLLGVAFYNARIGRRRLEAQSPGEPRRFIMTVSAEIMLGGLVMLAAASLSQTTTAKGVFERPDDRPFDGTTENGALAVRLRIDPNRTGINTYTATISSAGAPVEAERVRLTFRYLDDQSQGAATLNLAGTPAKPGAYVGQGPFLTLEGQWRVEAEVRRPNVDDVVTFFNVRPAGASAATLRRGGPWANPAPGLGWNTFGGLLIAICALGLALFKDRLPRPAAVTKRRALSWSLNGLTMIAFGAGSLLLFGVHNDQAVIASPKNPIFPDRNSIEQGRQIFQANCVACHGQRGVPPQGLNLSPYPLDLTVHVPLHSDGTVHNFIANGIAGSSMRAWSRGDGKFSDDQIWHLVNYLRTLGTVDR